MTSTQRVIKYLAIAFGIFLTVNIIGAIVFGIFAFTSVMTTVGGDITYSSDATSGNVLDFTQTYEDITELKLDVDNANVNIKKGDTLKVEASNVSNNFKCVKNDNKLEIREIKKNFWFFKNSLQTVTITIYIPEDINFDKVKLDLGVGKTEIEHLNVKVLKLDAGVGNLVLNDVNAETADIDGGVGRTDIYNGTFTKLILDCAIGEFNLNGIVKELADIDCGIGKLDMNLNDSIDNYSVITNTGIGAITLNGIKCSDGQKIGSGDATIKLDGGIGSVNVTFNEGNVI